MKTSELTGAALNWAVAKCLGYEDRHFCSHDKHFRDEDDYWFSPVDDWAQAGPIIEREKIQLEYRVGVHWTATRVEGSAVCEVTGPTQLIAAMRCYVKSQFGDEIETPEELK